LSTPCGSGSNANPRLIPHGGPAFASRESYCLTDHFYGERSATVRDPFGHEWMLGAQIEALTPEEMQRRYTALFDS
ncbi:VOC family protein, partial [Paraburkholderia sp. Cpub6]|uniref:VOC family protein n=1 Tax=Paraburkholderia sp. Cpub6 TaxID=2723094 RepID=UPI003905CDBA